MSHADKIIFNSIGQLQRFSEQSKGIVRGLRLNPGVSSSDFDLADPSRVPSRGWANGDAAKVEGVIDQITGFMVHNNCENEDFSHFDRLLTEVEARFGHLFERVEWGQSRGWHSLHGQGLSARRFLRAA